MKFTETHEWIVVQNNHAKVGISNYAQKELGDIVYVELPIPGKEVKAGEVICVLESTKAAADVYSPVSGVITSVNNLLKSNPELINQQSEKEGWLIELTLKDPQELNSLIEETVYHSRNR